MATISNKNISTIINKFIKNQKEFENYIKHCINILKNYNWLHDNQYNEEINDFEYFNKFINTNGNNFFTLLIYYEEYRNNYLKKLPQENINTIRTNIYTHNETKTINEILNKMLQEKNNNTTKFSRACYIIIENECNLDNKKEYKIEELYDLITNKKIIILDSYLEQIDINIEELDKKIKNEEVVFYESDTCEFIGYNTKPISDYFTLKTDIDKQIWFMSNKVFCKYVRYNIINFNKEEENKVNCNKNFYEVIKHIMNIINNMQKHYYKKKKKIPSVYLKVINETLKNLEEQRNYFEIKNNNNIKKEV